jgi:hypothetical protein
MSTFRPTQLVRPQVLSRLKRSSILALLNPFSDHLASRGISLSAFADDKEPLAPLIAVLAAPTESTPPELVERLELLDMIRSSALVFEEGHSSLVERHLAKDDSTGDLAVKILIHAPEVAWREFDRRAHQADRAMVAFSVPSGMPFQMPDDALLRRFETLAGPWFEENARSPFCRVTTRVEEGMVGFAIRHGDLVRRFDVCEEDGSTGLRILRPERLDLARYNLSTGEWQISGIGKKVQEFYRKLFGLIFHGSPSALVHSRHYSLEPLREGPDSLICDPFSAVQFARLRALKLRLPSGGLLTVSGDDVFRSLDYLGSLILGTAELVEACIELKLANRKRRQRVILCPVRDKVSGTQVNAAIEPWLARKGFVNHAADDSFVLESA